MINNIEGQSKAELINIIECQQEHDQQREQYIKSLQAEIERVTKSSNRAVHRAVRAEQRAETLQRRIEELEREVSEQKSALDTVADKLDLKKSDCNFVVWIDEALTQRDTEQHIKGAVECCKWFNLNPDNPFTQQLRANGGGEC